MEEQTKFPLRSKIPWRNAPSASSSRTRSAKVSPGHSGRDRASRLSDSGIKKQAISKEQAKGFYAVHVGKPFFDGLCEFMSSGHWF